MSYPIHIYRERIIDDELVSFYDKYYDYKDVAIDDYRIFLSQKGLTSSEIQHELEFIDDVIQDCMAFHEEFFYFEDIDNNEDYDEFKDILFEYVHSNF